MPVKKSGGPSVLGLSIIFYVAARKLSLRVALLLLAGLLVAALLLAYYLDWKSARSESWDDRHNEARRVAEEFWESLKEGRFDDAYALTGDGYRRQISLDAFSESLRAVPVLPAGPNVMHTESVVAVGGGRFSDSISLRHLDKKRTFHFSIQVGREDSLLRRRPPPARVLDFMVRELPGHASGVRPEPDPGPPRHSRENN